MPPGHYPLQWDAVYTEGLRGTGGVWKESVNVWCVDGSVYTSARIIQCVRLTAL